MRNSCERGEDNCASCSRGGAAPPDCSSCSSCSTSNMETWDQTHTYSNYQPICYHNPHMGQQQQHKQTTNNIINPQEADGRLGCAEVSSTSEREGCLAEQKDGQREIGGPGMGDKGHGQENFGSIITMLSEITANQCDLDEFLTDQSPIQGDYRTHGGAQHPEQQHRSMQDPHVINMQTTEVKQEHPELGYTYMGPTTQDYYSSYHPRTNVPHIPHQDGSGSVETMYRPRSISSVSSGSEGAEGSLGSEGPEGDRGYDRGTSYRMDGLPPQGVVLGIKSENKTKDEKYWERRRKNNLAAKKSRDARRVRENQLRLRVLCLENANRVLRSQVDREHEENVYLREKLQKVEQEKQTNPVGS